MKLTERFREISWFQHFFSHPGEKKKTTTHTTSITGTYPTSRGSHPADHTDIWLWEEEEEGKVPFI